MALPVTTGGNPTIETITKDSWVLVAQNVFGLKIKKNFNSSQDVFFTFVANGDTAPLGLDIPKQSITEQGINFIDGSTARDCYIYAVDENADVELEAVSSINTALNNTLSDSKTGIVQTTFADDSRVKGYERVFKDFLEDVPAGISWYLFDMSAVDADRTVFTLPAVINVSNGPVAVELFEDVTITANGTPLNTFNPNRLSGFQHQAVLYAGATISDVGTKIDGEAFGTAGGIFTPAVGGEGGSSQPFILDKTKKYAFRVNKTIAGAIDVLNAFFAWFELPPE